MNQELLARARQLRARASVVAEASSSRLDSEVRGKPDSTVPRIGGVSTFDEIAQRLDGCRTDRDLELAISACESALEAILKRPQGPKVKTKMELLYGCWSGDYYKAAAKASGVSESSVLRWRAEVGLDPYNGDRGKKAA